MIPQAMAQAMASGLQKPKPKPGASPSQALGLAWPEPSQAKHGLWLPGQASTSLPSTLVLATKTYQIARTRRSISAVIYALNGLHFGVLEHIKISQNELELTEIFGPSPPGTGTKNPSNHKKTMADLGGPLRVKKALFWCIRAY